MEKRKTLWWNLERIGNGYTLQAHLVRTHPSEGLRSDFQPLDGHKIYGYGRMIYITLFSRLGVFMDP